MSNSSLTSTTTLTQSPLIKAILSSHGLLGVGGQLDLTLIEPSQEPLEVDSRDEVDEVEEEIKGKLVECQWATCTLKFTTRSDLALHVNNEHMVWIQKSGYSCLWRGCSRLGKTFNARYKMLIHVRTHTNEKPHICGDCGKSFTRIENLKIHIRTHTGEKPYICPMKDCGKAYSNSSDRFKHIRTHYHDKPYVCPRKDCTKRYTDPSSLRKHIKACNHSLKGGKEAHDGPLDLSKT